MAGNLSRLEEIECHRHLMPSYVINNFNDIEMISYLWNCTLHIFESLKNFSWQFFWNCFHFLSHDSVIERPLVTSHFWGRRVADSWSSFKEFKFDWKKDFWYDINGGRGRCNSIYLEFSCWSFCTTWVPSKMALLLSHTFRSPWWHYIWMLLKWMKKWNKLVVDLTQWNTFKLRVEPLTQKKSICSALWVAKSTWEYKIIRAT